MLAFGLATGPTHPSFQFIECFFNPRLRFFPRCNPANPLISLYSTLIVGVR